MRKVATVDASQAHAPSQAADSLAEDHPHLALYLRSLSGESSTTFDPNGPTDDSSAGQPDLDAVSDGMLLRVREIMEASERGELTGAETDARLREVVEAAVNGQVEAGRAIGEAMDTEQDGGTVRARTGNNEDDGPTKRVRDEAGR